MCFRGNNKIVRPPFEFQRNGPVVKGPAGHKPDFSLAITRPSSAIRGKNLANKTPRRTKVATLDNVVIVDSLSHSNYKKCKEIDLSGKKLGKVDINTLRELENLRKLDISDNCLSLEPFSVIPRLEELDISCNGLKKFDFSESEHYVGSERAWKSLKKLNLGFNYCYSFITDIMLMPNLSWLCLSHNNISELPPNMMHFTNLKYLDLSSNSLNSETAFFALATVPSLEILILDSNKILQIPVFDFGFESLTKLSLKNNQIELCEDVEPVLDIESLEQINLMENPICLKLKEIPLARQMFHDANIELLMSEPKKQKKSVLPEKLRTINFDPLCLPSFTKQHIQALNRKTPRGKKSDLLVSEIDDEDLDGKQGYENEDYSNNDKLTGEVFMTDFGNVQTDDPQPIEIPETPLPDENEPENVQTSIWNEVPVIQAQGRHALTSKTKSRFEYAFRRLVFIVEHPDHRIKPRESPSTEPPETPKSQQTQNLILKPQPNMKVASRKKKPVASKLQARTEYTKTEVQQMLRSMEQRLAVVENDLARVDESGHTAVEVALDQRNFTNLHKQYESIRAELLNTLNS